MAQTLTFPPGRGGTFEDIPSEQRMYAPGDNLPILLDTEGNPSSRLIPYDKRLLNRDAINKMDPDEYQAIFGLFHPRDAQGGVTMPQSSTTYLTAPTDISEGDAILQQSQRLKELGIYTDPEPEWPGLQDVVEFMGPGTGAYAGGAAGLALGGPIGAGIGALAGGALGAVPGELTRSSLTPSRLTPEEQGQHNTEYGDRTGMEWAMLQGGMEGLTGELASQISSLGKGALMSYGRKKFIRDIDMSPDQQARLIDPNGPFMKGADLTGQKAYPRVSAYGRGSVETLDHKVSRSLFADYTTEQHHRNVVKNLGSIITDHTSKLGATGENQAIGERLTSWIGHIDKEGIFHRGTLEQGMRKVQRGLYDGIDTILGQHPNAPMINSAPMIDLFTTRGTGQGEVRPVAQNISDRLARQLSDLDQQTVKSTQTMTETAQAGNLSVRGVENQSQQLTPGTAQITEGAQGSMSLTGAPPGNAQVLGTGGVVPDVPSGAQGITQTMDNTTSATTRTDLPLGGWLHTLDAQNLTHNPEITIGRAMQIRSEVSGLLGIEKKAAQPNAENIAFLSRLQSTLDRSIDPTLRNIDPNLIGMYRQARSFTRQMYQDLRNDQIMSDVINTVGKNPEEFRTFATKPHAVQLHRAIEEAFTVSRHVPPGVNVPPELRAAPRIWEEVIRPEIRFQLLKEALPTSNQDTLKYITNSAAPIKDLLKENRILTPEPGALLALRDKIGQDTYKQIMGPEGELLLQMDHALQDVHLGRKVRQEVGLVVLQWTGLSLIGGAAGTLAARGQVMHGLVGLGTGGAMVLSPYVMNKMLTNPAMFEKLILGIHTGASDPRVSRLLGQLAVQSGREIGMIPSVREPDPR